MSDIVAEIRGHLQTMAPHQRARLTAEQLTKAADEIERLRLTDAEVNAIRLGELAYPGLRITDNGKWVDVWATLRGLLARLEAAK